MPIERSPLHAEIRKALTALAIACRCGEWHADKMVLSESGTERFFLLLDEAVSKVNAEWDIVEDSHKHGLCFDVEAMLTDALADTIGENERMGSA